MADAYKLLYQGQLPAVAATLFTANASPFGTIVKHISIANMTAADVTFQLFRGGTAAANSLNPSTWTVPANGKMEWDGTMALSPGGTIAGVAGAATALTCTICGDEVT